MTYIPHTRRAEQGATALLIVIFSVLLFIVVSVVLNLVTGIG